MQTDAIHMIPSNALNKLGFETVRERLTSTTRTPSGADLAENLLPSRSLAELEQLRAETAEMLSLLKADLNFPLEQLDDISDSLSRSNASGAMLSADSFPAILAQLRSSRLTRSFLNKNRESIPVLASMGDTLPTLKDLESAINSAISDQGEVKENASPELKRIRKKLNGQKLSLRNSIQKLFRKLSGEGITSDEGPTIRSGRMVIPVKSEYKRKLDGFVHDVSSSGQTVYLEPVEALHINNDIRELEAEEQREIVRILINLTRLVRNHRPAISDMTQRLGQLDLIHARCKTSQLWNGVLPELSSRQALHLRHAFNPNLVLKNNRLTPDAREPIVPLNLELSKNEQGIIISGPNAGGKSVALKTVGCLVAMHQCGIPIPADPDSEFPVFSSLHLDIGDEQSIENDLSTFSSRLSWMRQTLSAIDNDSLVLIDEAGSGTDPDEGSALFQAYMEQLLDKNVRFIVSTHHNALKQFAHNHGKIANAAMEFDQETLSPTYRFRKHIPGSSYAFEIAGRLELPTDILNRAKELLGDHHDTMTRLLLDLEKELQLSRASRLDNEKQTSLADQQALEYRKKSELIEKEKSEILAKAHEQADRILKGANRKVEQAVEMIVQKGQTDRAKVKEARQLIEKGKSDNRRALNKRTRHKKETTETPDIGDFVKMTDGSVVGELIEKDGNQAIVLAGGLRIKTTLNKLTRTERPSKQNAADKLSNWKQRDRVTQIDRKSVGPSLDIRGVRGEEAVQKVMHYIDNAIAAGLLNVDIIHGTGEGILKRLVREYLSERKDISGYEEAPLERGGAGCTIVSL